MVLAFSGVCQMEKGTSLFSKVPLPPNSIIFLLTSFHFHTNEFLYVGPM